MKTLILLASLYGPYNADLVEVKDGDTAVLEVHIWPGVIARVSVREDGVDTPEKRTRNLCEKAMGYAATQFTEDFLVGEITLTGVRLGKYAGRVLGSMHSDGFSLRDALIATGKGRPYDGGKREPWCVPRETTHGTPDTVD